MRRDGTGRHGAATTILLLVLTIGLAVVGRAEDTPQAAFTPPTAWGPTTNGLRIAISSASSALPASGGEFWIAIQNAGTADFVVNLGFMLGNGKVMFPLAVRLVVADSTGTPRELQFSDRYPAIAGRVDDFTVALRAGAIYSLPVSLDQYVTAAARRVQLTPGRYRIFARLEGHGAATDNLDMKGVALLNFWKGSTQSNVVEFDVSRTMR